MKFQGLALIALYLLLLSIPTLARETTMQLLAPSKGWALNDGRLFWTADNGEHWTDITPERGAATIAHVFFLDDSRGSVLLQADAGDDMIKLNLAQTANGGHDWSFTPVPIPNQFPGELSGVVGLDFVDSDHGWVVLRKMTSSAFSLGRLIATQDGGNTWRALPEMPLGAPVVFVNPVNGWLVGDSGVGGSWNLYRTRDGGKTWQGADIGDPEPAAAGMTTMVYSRLDFTDAKHGSVIITFSPIDTTKGSRLILFTTADGGTVWKPDRTLQLRNMYGASPLPAILADAALIVLSDATLTKISTDGSINRNKVNGRSDIAFSEISFTSATDGWLRTIDGKLLATNDGGTTLRWLIPGSSPRALPPPTPTSHSITSAPVPGASVGLSAPLNIAPPAARGLHQSQRLGFDKQQSLTSAEMTTWWKSSPFFDVGFYIGGANYCYKKVGNVCQIRLDPNIIKSWVTDKMNEGWGLMPLWVGLQAPCSSTAFSHFSSDPTTAYAQGKTEADKASAAMTALGLASTVVFYDMEPYSAPVGSACSKAVQAFLTGWSLEMHINNYNVTAVYGNALPAARDFSQLTPPNDINEVWIAQTQAAGNKWPRVTIWGLGSAPNALPDNLWKNHNRGHQFLQQVSASYGGLTNAIDYDVEDFEIPGTTAGIKPYTWTVNTIDLS